MNINTCPKCNATLNNDEKASGKCFSCGATFQTDWTKKIDEIPMNDLNKNKIAGAIKIIGIILLGVCSIGNALIWISNSLITFFIAEFIIVAFVLLLIGLSEIINLLEEIKNNTKNNLIH